MLYLAALLTIIITGRIFGNLCIDFYNSPEFAEAYPGNWTPVENDMFISVSFYIFIPVALISLFRTKTRFNGIEFLLGVLSVLVQGFALFLVTLDTIEFSPVKHRDLLLTIWFVSFFAIIILLHINFFLGRREKRLGKIPFPGKRKKA